MTDKAAGEGVGRRPGPRLALWTTGLVLLPIVAYYVGLRVNDSQCSGDSDCDLGGLTGFVLAGMALSLALTVGTVLEVVLYVRRRRVRPK